MESSSDVDNNLNKQLDPFWLLVSILVDLVYLRHLSYGQHVPFCSDADHGNDDDDDDGDDDVAVAVVIIVMTKLDYRIAL
ncbi:hypothetical protein DERF_013288, partial [Dermatophagoides farinae]